MAFHLAAGIFRELINEGIDILKSPGFKEEITLLMSIRSKEVSSFLQVLKFLEIPLRQPLKTSAPGLVLP